LSGKLTGLTTRAVVVIGPDTKVKHVELVPEIGQEPDYAAALAVL
jgi:thiol peroxidase